MTTNTVATSTTSAVASTTRRVTVATIWVTLGFGAEQAIRLFGNLVLAWLLFPEAFGLMAIANALIMSLDMMSDFGLAPVVVRDERGDEPSFLNTIWTIQVIRNVALSLIMCALAWPLALFYNEPELCPLLLFAGLPLLTRGFNSTAVYTWQRHMEMPKLCAVQLIPRIFAVGTTIVWALFHRSVWALMVGLLVGSIVRLILSHLLLQKTRNRFCWDRDAARDLWRFGKWVLAATFIYALSFQCDRLILGSFIPLGTLGVYSIAANLTAMARGLMSQVQSKVILPTLSSMKSRPRTKLRQSLLQRRRWLLLGTVLFLTPLVSFGDVFVRTLYDSRYYDAGWQLQLLSMGLWPRILLMTMSPALMAIGSPQYVALGNGLRFFAILLGLPLGFFLGGLPGALSLLVASEAFAYFGMAMGLHREQLSALRQDAVATVGLALLIGSVFLLRSGQPFAI